MRTVPHALRSAAKGAANLLGVRRRSSTYAGPGRTLRGGGAAASAEQALVAEQAIERRRSRGSIDRRSIDAAPLKAKPAPPLARRKSLNSTPYASAGQRRRRVRRAPDDSVKLAAAAFDSAAAKQAYARYGDGPTARSLRRRSEGQKPSPRVKLSEPALEKRMSGKPMPLQLNRRPPPPTRRKSESDKALCCDRCDGDHPTTSCPHFKKDRGTHKDCTAMLGKKGKELGHCPPLVITRAKVVQQPPDGSCLFHSLAYGLREGNASALRRELMAFIRKHPELEISETALRDWIRWDALVSVQKYTDKMSRGGWGGGIEMAAFSELKGCSVEVYEQCSAGFKRISLFEKAGASRTVRVCYRGGVHYDALVIS